MKRRLNFTGRKRILRADIRLRTDETGAVPAVVVERLDLAGLSLAGEERIVLEAQRQMTFERIEIGPATSLTLPVRKELTNFLDLEGVTFRVKVVGTGDDSGGLILAAADGLTPESDPSEAATRSLLKFKSAELGQRVWELVLTEDDWPLVKVNKKAGDWHAFATSESFVAYVYPEIMAQVAVETLMDNAWEDPGTWQFEWGRFFTWLGKNPSDAPILDSDPEDLDEWINDLVDTFCRKHALADLVFKEDGDE